MTGPSLASEFFQKLKNERSQSAYLSSFVNSNPPTVETEWLDFKGAERLPDNKAKEIFSQALSGFANNQGGVLVFGLDCRKDGDPAVDRVSALSLVDQPDAFASRLMELHHQANEPPVLGVEILTIPHHEAAGKGFVVCYIPESPFRPHRTEFGGRQYWIRAGDDFIIPSVSILRNLFSPSSRAELVIQTKGDKGRTHPAVAVSVTNQGFATARDVMIAMTGSPSSQIYVSESWQLIPSAFSQTTYLSVRPIHPGETVDLLTFLHLEQWRQGLTMPSGFMLTLTFKVFGENLPPTKAMVSYNDDAIAYKAVQTGKMESL